jgi:hypothetical protein
LSELNTARKFLYSNNTASKPVDPEKLETIAGYGNSPVVKYEGKGAYFLDKLEDGVWCLEVMPDAIQVQDPFEKPSLKKDDVTIAWNKWNIEVSLPDLGENFTVTAINSNNRFKGLSKGTGFAVEPGVYLLTKKDYAPNKEWNAATPWNNILLGEYVAPRSRVKTFSVIHQPAKVTEANKILKIKADITGLSMPDSVIIYTDRISFWSDKNPYIKMERRQGYTYGANIPAEIIKTGVLRYNIVIFKNGKSYTSPANIEGSPLDWDYNQTKYWETEVVDPHDPIEILNVTDSYSGVETYCIPETSYSLAELNGNGLKEMKTIKYNFKVRDNEAQFFWIEYIKDCITERKDALRQFSTLYINLKNARGINKLKAGFVTSDGYTYTAPINISSNTQLYKIPLSGLSQDKTALLPFPYPVFLERYFAPETNIPFDKQNIEMIILSTTENVNENASIELGNIWIE